MTVGAVRRQLERVFAGGTVAGLTEGQLLDRFVARRDDAAFEALLVRHGPMVHSVCRRMLRDPNDVDDAFQATFLVLVRKAGTLRRRDLLGNWLYGVAFRVASRARSDSIRRTRQEMPTDELAEVAQVAPESSPDPALHEELHRLPEKYRAPVVLCYFEGLTHEQAADRLCWPVGTVKGRLARARDLLRTRLTRRGVTLATTMTALATLNRDARAALPERLVLPTVRAATGAAAGTSLAGLASSHALALSEGVIHAMSLSQIKSLAVVLTVAGTVVGGGAYAYQASGPPATKVARAAAKQPAVSQPASIDVGPDGRPLDRARPAEANKEGPDGRSLGQENQLAKQKRVALPGLPPSLVTPAPMVDLHAQALKTLRDYTGLGFAAYLGQITPATTSIQLREIADFSRQSLTTEIQLLGLGHDKVVAARRHVDRIIKLQETVSKLAGQIDRDMVVTASELVAQAQRESFKAIQGMATDPFSSPVAASEPPVAANPPVSAPVPPPGAAHPKSTTATTLPGGAPKPEPSKESGGTGGGGFGGTGDVDAQRARENRYRVAIAEVAPKLAEKDPSLKTKDILKKLDEPISMNFAKETPLEDLLRYIKSASQGPKDTGIPIYVDPVGLQDAEKTLTSPITLDLEGVPLKTTLRLALKQLGLAYCVKDGLLLISSPAGIAQELMESSTLRTLPEAEQLKGMLAPSGAGGFM